MAVTLGRNLTISASELIANDVGSGIKVVQVGTPTNGGSVAFDGNVITYTVNPEFYDRVNPNANSANAAHTIDSFPYTIQDSTGKTDTATVHIDISKFGVSTDTRPRPASYFGFGADGIGVTSGSPLPMVVSVRSQYVSRPGDLFVLTVADNGGPIGNHGVIEPGWTLLQEGGNELIHARAWYRVLDASYIAQHSAYTNQTSYPYFAGLSYSDTYSHIVGNVFRRDDDYVGNPLLQSIGFIVETPPAGTTTKYTIISPTKVIADDALLAYGYDGFSSITVLGITTMPLPAYTPLHSLISTLNDLLGSIQISVAILDADGSPATEGYLSLIRDSAFSPAEIARLPAEIFSGATSGTTAQPNTLTTSGLTRANKDGFVHTTANFYGRPGSPPYFIGGTVNGKLIMTGGAFEGAVPSAFFDDEHEVATGDSYDTYAVGGSALVTTLRIVMNLGDPTE